MSDPVISRRLFIETVAAAVVAAPAGVRAQPVGRTYRIGWLTLGADAADSSVVQEHFRQALGELGYVEGRNLAIEWRSADMKPERLPALAAELVRSKVDVIVATTTSPTRAARSATPTIPIVMLVVPDPVGVGLVSSLAHPGGNVTGLSFLVPDLIGKQLELLKDVVPRVSRVAILRDPASSGHRLMLRAAETSARSLGIHLLVVDAGGPGQFDSALTTVASGHADAVVVPAHPLFLAYRARLAELVARHRLPAIYGAAEHASAGGLIAYAPSLADSYRRGAYYVDRILKGTRPADLPVEQPTRFELLINLRTAKALDLTIPPAVLARADQVIQ